MILPLQNGHIDGRAKSPANRESGMMSFPFLAAGIPNGCAD